MPGIMDSHTEFAVRSNSCGGDISKFKRAQDAPKIDLKTIIPRTSSNPFLALRRAAFHAGVAQALPPAVNHPAANRPELTAADGAPVLPATLDWRTRFGGIWLASIQAQGSCGNCWAFAAAALVETMVKIEQAMWAKRSEGDIRDGWAATWNPAPTDICSHGAGVEDALSWVTSSGVADPQCYPYYGSDHPYTPTADRAGRTVRIPAAQSLGSVADQKQWLDTVGPIVAPIDAWPSFVNPSTGTWNGTAVWTTEPAVDISGPDNQNPPVNWPQGHVLLIVGYDDTQQCWIARNSWGTGWGNKGYCLFGYGQANIDSYTKYGVQFVSPDPWTRRRLHNGCMIQSSNGGLHQNFEVLIPTFVDIQHVWRQGGDNGDFSWHNAGAIAPQEAGGCPAPPALTSTTFGSNFEAVYLSPASSSHPVSLHHRFFDQSTQTWIDGGMFGPADVAGFPGFIQSDYGAPGNFEVVVRTSDGKLAHWWREGSAPWTWQESVRFGANVMASGPSLIQSHAGTGVRPGDFTTTLPGNFEVVAVLTDGTMQHWWRDNTLATPIWKAGATFGSGIPDTPVCMIEGTWGTIDETSLGNFELCVATGGGEVQHWWLDNAGDHQWHMSTQFGSRVAHVWSLIESSWGNLEIIVETVDSGYEHYYRDGAGWHAGPILPL